MIATVTATAIVVVIVMVISALAFSIPKSEPSSVLSKLFSDV